MPRHATRTSFKAGNPGGPGRPPGSKDVMPRVRDLANEVLDGNRDAAKEALRRALVNPRTVQSCLDLIAKLNRELGSAAEGGVTPLVIVGDVGLEKYRQAARAVGRRPEQDDPDGE